MKEHEVIENYTEVYPWKKDGSPTQVMREVNIMPFKRNVETHIYLDDGLIRIALPEKVAAKVMVILILCYWRKLEVALKKSELPPSNT